MHILPAGTSVAAAWEFNTNLNKEGWTELNTGTRTQEWPDPNWSTRSEPVKYVAGGYYVVVVENSSDACPFPRPTNRASIWPGTRQSRSDSRTTPRRARCG